MPVTIDPATVDAVIFDMGGIFMLPHPTVTAATLRAAEVLTADHVDDEAFHRAHYSGMRAHDRTADPDDWQPYLVASLGALGVTGDLVPKAIEALEELFEGPSLELWIWSQPDATAVLERLAEHGLGVAVVSNCDGTAEEILRRAGVCQVGSGDGVEVVAVIDSGVVGVSKPDPAVFLPALTALGVEAHRTIYVGDSLRFDVGGAQAAGMHPVHFDPYGLYDEHDHDRVLSLTELVEHLVVD